MLLLLQLIEQVPELKKRADQLESENKELLANISEVLESANKKSKAGAREKGALSMSINNNVSKLVTASSFVDEKALTIDLTSISARRYSDPF